MTAVKCTACGKGCGQFFIQLDREAGQRVAIPLIICFGCNYKVRHGGTLTFVNPNNGHPMTLP